MINQIILSSWVRKALFAITLFLLLLQIQIPHTVMVVTSANAEDTVVAVVNNDKIYASDLEKIITEFKKRSQKNELTLEELNQLVSNLAIKRLILQHPDVQLMKNDAEIKRQVKAFEESLIVSGFVTSYIEKRVLVTEQDLRNYYKTHKDEFTVDKVQTASAILLRTREDAEKIHARVSQGEDFAKLASESSLDLRTAKNGGSLGVVEKTKVPLKMWDEIMKLEAGQIGNIVETKYGYAIVKVDRVVAPESVKPFEEVREEARRSFIPKQKEQIYDAMVVNLKKDAAIKIFEERILELSNTTQ